MKKLIVYFSTKGNTRMAAEKLGKLTNADIYEIQPSIPYSDDDLNWRNKKSPLYQHRPKRDTRGPYQPPRGGR